MRVESTQRELIDRDEALRQLKTHLLRAQDRMKTQADKHRKEREFEVRDMVFLKLKQHMRHSVMARISPKLSARYYGPFKILEKIGKVAYKLQLPPTSRIHPMFHVSLLKKVVGNYEAEADLPTGLEDDRADIIEPEAVLASRRVIKHGERLKQWLIQWKGKSVDEATWEDEISIRSQFPTLCLEDKTIAQGGGIDTTIGEELREPLVHEDNQGRWGRVYGRKGH